MRLEPKGGVVNGIELKTNKAYDIFDHHGRLTGIEIESLTCLCGEPIVLDQGNYKCTGKYCGRHLNTNGTKNPMPALQTA